MARWWFRFLSAELEAGSSLPAWCLLDRGGAARGDPPGSLLALPFQGYSMRQPTTHGQHSFQPLWGGSTARLGNGVQTPEIRGSPRNPPFPPSFFPAQLHVPDPTHAPECLGKAQPTFADPSSGERARAGPLLPKTVGGEAVPRFRPVAKLPLRVGGKVCRPPPPRLLRPARQRREEGGQAASCLCGTRLFHPCLCGLPGLVLPREIFLCAEQPLQTMPPCMGLGR